MAASTTLTPEQRRERARKAALARTTVDAHINALVKAAPSKPTAERTRLASKLALAAARVLAAGESG